MLQHLQTADTFLILGILTTTIHFPWHLIGQLGSTMMVSLLIIKDLSLNKDDISFRGLVCQLPMLITFFQGKMIFLSFSFVVTTTFLLASITVGNGNICFTRMD